MSKKYIFLCIFLVVSLVGCDFLEKDGDNEPEPDPVLISYEKLTNPSISVVTIDFLLDKTGLFNDKVLQNGTEFSVDVYQVVYKTTYKGAEKQVSGACIIPGTAEPLPVLSYQHGTILHNKDAPSQYKDLFDMPLEVALNIVIASCGYVCAAPDYIGYGTDGSSLHPYHHADSLATSCIDMLRAVKEMCAELGVSIKNEYYLTGYSEGGFATLAVQKKIEAGFAAEFPLIAVSAGAGAYNLLDTARDFLSRPIIDAPVFACFLFVAYRGHYGWDRAYSSVFREPYSSRMKSGLFSGSYTLSYVEGQLTNSTDDLFKADFLSDFNGSGEQTLKDALRENKLHKGWTPSAPLRLYHGTADRTVPAFNSEDAENAFISSGAADVRYFSFPGLGHGASIIPWVIATMQWFLSF
ncbi:MAG: hypothetical protein KAT34_05535 [Candidatus Aminicenantes bacterium]|nr:hypothetical protein [Candidatus Aminicenantes bacterium]